MRESSAFVRGLQHIVTLGRQTRREVTPRARHGPGPPHATQASRTYIAIMCRFLIPPGLKPQHFARRKSSSFLWVRALPWHRRWECAGASASGQSLACRCPPASPNAPARARHARLAGGARRKRAPGTALCGRFQLETTAANWRLSVMARTDLVDLPVALQAFRRPCCSVVHLSPPWQRA
jgi:hypothetical protein